MLLLYVHSNIRQTYGVEIFGRRLEDESIRQSACILTINLGLMLAATIAIMVSQNPPMSDVFFETCSAIGTSGMSTGVTRSLNSFSRIVIILLMYCGRIGSLSFALAFTRSNRKPHAAAGRADYHRIERGIRDEINSCYRNRKVWPASV